VLLVDDADDCLAMLDLALQGLPDVTLQTTRSAEGAQAFLERALLESAGVSALVTDLQLPGMSGLDLIAWIRRQPHLEALPIIVVSAAADPSVPQAVYASGAQAYFPKPFSPAALRRKLEQLMHA
jgi:CheY-like chemotaxis protein